MEVVRAPLLRPLSGEILLIVVVYPSLPPQFCTHLELGIVALRFIVFPIIRAHQLSVFFPPLGALGGVMRFALNSGHAEHIMPSVAAPDSVVRVMLAMPFLLCGEEGGPFLGRHIRATLPLIGEVLFAMRLAPLAPLLRSPITSAHFVSPSMISLHRDEDHHREPHRDEDH